jgi:hypothetical protein
MNTVDSGGRGLLALAIVSMLVLGANQDAIAAKSQDAKTARSIDGHPDLSGVWINGDMAFVTPQKKPDGSVCVLCRDPAAPPPKLPLSSRPKYKPEFVEKVADLNKRQVEMDKTLKCGNPGLPRIGPPDAIVQTPGQIVFLYDDLSGSFFRMIPTDGRPHLTDSEESYLGDSVGKWEGDTLVIEAVHFIDDFWLMDNGAFHSPSLKVTERLKRVGNTIEYQATADDPGVLLEPWKLLPRNLQLSDKPLAEPIPCVENDLSHVVDGTHHDNPR